MDALVSPLQYEGRYWCIDGDAKPVNATDGYAKLLEPLDFRGLEDESYDWTLGHTDLLTVLSPHPFSQLEETLRNCPFDD